MNNTNSNWQEQQIENGEIEDANDEKKEKLRKKILNKNGTNEIT